MIYLDNAATTYPKPDVVLNEMFDVMKYSGGNPGRGSHSLSLAAADKIYETRNTVAAHFGASPENVVFTYNTTYALNIAIKAFARRNSHVLISDIEHNSVYRPVYALSRSGISFDLFNASCNEEAVIKSIYSQLRPNTGMICTALASNVCGITLSAEKIGALCRNHGIVFIADAAQCAGSRRINIETAGIDALCAPAHKGLYGPQGCGFIVFSKRHTDNAARLPTFAEGGSGVNSLDRNMPSVLPERFEAGTLGTPCIAGLQAGIRFVESIGAENIYEHENALRRRAADMLSSLPNVKIYAPESDNGGILLFNIAGRPSTEVAEALDKQKICVRAGFHCAPLAHAKLKTGENGAVRLSFGVYNRAQELESFYRCVRELI
ncbi:MAG: aminotransferase class V-fold PLP-dependent enzyme [Eubacteriales bacterium]|jgi:cysteine desulfurase family protein|nr:aminotransferase class V-fold PLP-dependent enzyme [Eubacteriales bacterium]